MLLLSTSSSLMLTEGVSMLLLSTSSSLMLTEGVSTLLLVLSISSDILQNIISSSMGDNKVCRMDSTDAKYVNSCETAIVQVLRPVRNMMLTERIISLYCVHQQMLRYDMMTQYDAII